MGIVFSGSLDEIGIFQLKASLEAHVNDDLLRFASVMYNKLAYSCGSSMRSLLSHAWSDRFQANSIEQVIPPKYASFLHITLKRGTIRSFWFVIDRASNPEGWIMEHALRKPETDLASSLNPKIKDRKTNATCHTVSPFTIRL